MARADHWGTELLFLCVTHVLHASFIVGTVLDNGCIRTNCMTSNLPFFMDDQSMEITTSVFIIINIHTVFNTYNFKIIFALIIKKSHFYWRRIILTCAQYFNLMIFNVFFQNILPGSWQDVVKDNWGE